MSWKAGFSVDYQGTPVHFAFAYPGRLWWALDDLCAVFQIPESPAVIYLDLADQDKAEIDPYHTRVVDSVALRSWVEPAALDRFHAWIRTWLFPLLGTAFSSGIRNEAEAMAVLYKRGVTTWSEDEKF